MFNFDEFEKQVYLKAARGNGKGFTQLKMYQEFLKGEQLDMSFRGIFKKNTNDEAKPITGVGLSGIESTTPTTEEEWVWVKGYKGTDRNMCCIGGYQYELDKQFDMPEDADITLCHSGFHFCKSLTNVFAHYDISNGNRFFEVEALVRAKGKPADASSWTTPIYYASMYNDKRTSKSIRLIRELTVDEVFEACGDEEVCKWTDDQKRRAMETSIKTVRSEIRVNALVEAGYSRPFATYIAAEDSKYITAINVASQPGVSMDVKVLAIFCENT